MIPRKKIQSMLLLLCVPTLNLSFDHDFFLGPKHCYRRLFFDNPSKLDGWMTGLSSGFNFSHKWFIANIWYEGVWNTPLLHGKPYQTSRVHEHMLSFRMGGIWDATDCFDLYGTVGLGFTRLLNHQDPHSDACKDNDTDGLRYRYTKMFVPVSLGANWHVTDHTMVTLYGEWRPDVLARLKIRVNTTKCCPLLHCTIDNDRSHAVRIMLPITHFIRCNDRFYFQAAPFFDWNRFGGACLCNENGNPQAIERLTRWDIGGSWLFGVQF